MTKGRKLILLGVLLVLADQIIKILVKTNMSLGESIHVFGDWFQIFFIENEGMAFGLKFGGQIGKLLLTVFRLVFFGVLVWWISGLLRKKTVPAGVTIGLTLIAAGALGNIIDCMFYGIIWDYAPVMFGKVVDMFYFPIIDTTFPDWVPFKGGERFLFFAPVFNFADSCVTCGALYLIFFQYKFFSKEENYSIKGE